MLNKNILATWMCVDQPDEGTYFPSSMGNSSEKKTQDIYWRCVINCLFTARLHNPSLTLVLFSNVTDLPIVDGVSLMETLSKLDVKFISTDFKYKTPAGYYDKWRNQFYEFSILEHIASDSYFADADNFSLIDSDCLITGDLSPMYDELNNYHFLGYPVPYEGNHPINGVSKIDMRSVYEALSGEKVGTIPNYYAGEYLAAKIHVVKALFNEFVPTWARLLELNKAGAKKLNEEAHVLSYLYWKLGMENGLGEMFIKRLWTDPSTYRNVLPGNEELLIWHLPAEKTKGLESVYNYIKGRTNFDVQTVNKAEFKRLTSSWVNVPDAPFGRTLKALSKTVVKTILKRTRSGRPAH